MNEKNYIRLDELPPEHPLRQQPFSAPEGYFDALPAQIQARAMRRPKPAFSISWSWQRTAATLAGAGLIAVLVWQTLPERQESLPGETLAGVSNATITAYLEEQGVDPDQLMESQQLHSSLNDETDGIDYLNVEPTDIQQHIDAQTAPETQNQES
ncbi:hypothetical protein [Spirosoma montaniterrae]|uniref:Uncharacterized protein n=1 Tax=Spirosoma montaniterrae TaxID=1178516 RepID=A0A1P9WUI1_9BACT|nr:hypothetical protein [Spirosoma montaniterrae]AQG79034.1 hypothetical protein AWR27_06670 [Spirosoma montaniterrae]